ncbi:hypothetical protein TRV_01129 [Trichophyton verrucosum HKI 0517]|uniref:F-box domain-containing protein n=1 Tax=Trichophyton verrucosum (strain HKI 0517) TaxID=663202 RepID=D4D227_TRIVH|nr:uncharacterized protein TRV_01129 [Trichophyton verrucosum HKI 0517]EFE44111.1 hypothetical protein TRV_01129 [Trichophyton verrucosum HKI 0517]
MAVSLSSPGSSSSSSFDPYSENVTDSNSQNKSQAGTPGQDDSDVAASSSTVVASSAHSSQFVSRGHRLETPKNASTATEITTSATNSTQSRRKRKRGAAGDHPAGTQVSDAQYSSEYDSRHFGVKSQSDSPSSFVDGTKRVKFRDDVKPDFSVDPSMDTIPEDKSKLPREIWQHIFTFLPPVSLGRVLQVNRTFKALLTTGQPELPSGRATPGSLKYVNPVHIWSISRKSFHSSMPRPLSPLSEMDMWKLIRGTSCQFCNKAGSVQSPETSPFESGPGENGVRIIWPLAVRSCGDCLKANCDTEMDLLFSSTLPSVLVPALPFAFLTASLHYVSSVSLRGNQPPVGMVLTKHFLKSQVEELKSRFEEVKALGPAAAEEWMKGLDGNGKEKIADAARWEQWELAGGLRSLKSPHQAPSNGTKTQSAKPETADTASARLPIANHRPSNSLGGNAPSTNLDTAITSRPRSTGAQPGFPLPPNSQLSRERNLRQINEAKASRRSEIERRCAELDPPLAPEVINHMESFTAAIQITHPFTDRDWEILKPRLLAQREVAERRENERKLHDALLQAKSDERRHQEAQLKEAKELLDREWEDVQKPIKERMAGYADEIIREGWRGGEGVTKEKCPKFAADVIMYVRKRFLEDLAQEDARARAEGKPIEEDPPNGPPRRKIILENMKFIFDTKIKLLTEQFQKELFLCNGCDNNAKYYGFEGVIQHYAAKHTNVLSLGSVVVHWRAEWPERPPFNPDPASAKLLMYPMPRPHGGQPHMGYTNPQPSPGPYNRTPYGTPYAYGTGPYRPPSPQYYPPPPGYGFSPQQPYPPGPYEHQHAPPNPPYGSPFPGQAYPPPYAPADPGRHPGPPYQPPYSGPSHPPGPYNPAYPPAPHHSRPPAGAHKPNQGSQSFGLYQTHLDEIAKNARSVWNGTSGIKDLPHNVRAHVVIHHVTTRFVDKFGQEPALTLFSDGLNSHPHMKPIRNLSGLVCKACTDMASSRRSRQHDSRNDRKMYHLPALFSHFQSVHVDAAAPDGTQPDWKVHMLLLPDNAVISSLGQAPGMDQAKFHLITSAFPWVFSPITAPIAPAPVKAVIKPNIHGAYEAKTSEHTKYPAASHGGKKSANHQVLEVAVDDFPRFVESPDDPKHFEPPRYDEYDPHRPAFIETATDPYARGARGNAGPREKIQVKHRQIEAVPGEETEMQADSRRPRQQQQKHSSRGKERAAKSGGADIVHPAAGSGHSQPGTNRPKSRNVSEDGEVAESNEARAEGGPSPTEEMNAAEHFLNNFVPGQDQGDFGTTSRGSNPQTHGESRSKWPKTAAAEEREWRTSTNSHAGAEAGHTAQPGRGGKHNGWAGRGKSPAVGREYREFDPRGEAFDMHSGPPSVRGDVLTPDQTEARGRSRVATADVKGGPEARGGRPHNRFERYEAQRQESLRPRSRSPLPQERTAVEYYRNRSPRARQRAAALAPSHPQEAYVERIPIDHPSYARAPPQGQYRYVEEYIEPSYEGAVEYVPVRVAAREPQNGGQYYIERPVHRGVPQEYVDYDMEYSRHPVIEQPQHYYHGPSTRDIPEGPPVGSRRARYR